MTIIDFYRKGAIIFYKILLRYFLFDILLDFFGFPSKEIKKLRKMP